MNEYIKQSFLEDGFTEDEINDWLLDDKYNSGSDLNYKFVNE
jgi:hypothetical protein